MPKRTNPRQQIIALLMKTNEGPGCVVTESKSLHDVQSGVDREVDVVVERLIDRETITWSYEVVARRRPADIEWVEAMIAKHAYLPTEKLFRTEWPEDQGYPCRVDTHARDRDPNRLQPS